MQTLQKVKTACELFTESCTKRVNFSETVHIGFANFSERVAELGDFTESAAGLYPVQKVWLSLSPRSLGMMGVRGPGGFCTLRSPSISLLQDWCLAPSLGALAGAACLAPPLQPALRGTSRTPRPQQLCGARVPEARARRGSQGGLGSPRPGGALCTTEQGAARASPTRTRSAFTIATWTSSGSTLPSESAWPWVVGGDREVGAPWPGPQPHPGAPQPTSARSAHGSLGSACSARGGLSSGPVCRSGVRLPSPGRAWPGRNPISEFLICWEGEPSL